MRATRSASFRFVAGVRAAATLAVAGCGGGGSSPGAADPSLVGTWRIYSERIDFDGGGSNTIPPGPQRLDLGADGRWQFESSSGAWTTGAIDPSDWTRWGVMPYGPVRKLDLAGWNGDRGDGPIEELDTRVDFVWVIYHSADPPDPGLVQIKLGHV